jgi:hypothetical protein
MTDETPNIMETTFDIYAIINPSQMREVYQIEMTRASF